MLHWVGRLRGHGASGQPPRSPIGIAQVSRNKILGFKVKVELLFPGGK